MKQIDITGLKFGRLTALGRVGTRNGQSLWLCSCECGSETRVVSHSLRRGATGSCGCLHAEMTSAAKRTHGKSATRTFKIWDAMLQRCGNPNSMYFSRYGGRGIVVCERWKSFANFLADMGERPSGCSIERLNNDGPYEPSNCKWSTAAEQSRNKSNNVFLEWRGERRCLSDWVGHNGLTRSAIKARLARGWTVERTLETPMR